MLGLHLVLLIHQILSSLYVREVDPWKLSLGKCNVPPLVADGRPCKCARTVALRKKHPSRCVANAEHPPEYAAELRRLSAPSKPLKGHLLGLHQKASAHRSCCSIYCGLIRVQRKNQELTKALPATFKGNEWDALWAGHGGVGRTLIQHLCLRKHQRPPLALEGPCAKGSRGRLQCSHQR